MTQAGMFLYDIQMELHHVDLFYWLTLRFEGVPVYTSTMQFTGTIYVK